MLDRLKEYLDGQGVRYEGITHYETYTSQETAQSAHIPGKELAKTVMVRIDGVMAMAVLPGTRKIDFDLLKKAAGADRVELASEQEFADRFADCEIGAMPPFGNLYDIEVYVDESLARSDEIVFNAGSHIDLIKMRYEDFERLVRPRIIGMSC